MGHRSLSEVRRKAPNTGLGVGTVDCAMMVRRAGRMSTWGEGVVMNVGKLIN